MHTINIAATTPLEQQKGIAAQMRRCAVAAIERVGAAPDCFVDITITDSNEIKEINKEYRNKEQITDVLSFPMFAFYNGAPQEPLERDPETGLLNLGDMVLCYQRAAEQAAEYGHSVDRECGFLTVHSVLHLLGYDHERGEADRLRMRALEEEILGGLGLVRD